MSNFSTSTPKARLFLKEILTDKPFFGSIKSSKSHSKMPSVVVRRGEDSEHVGVVENLKKQIFSLEVELKTKEKEIERLKNINFFLQGQNANKEMLIAEERKYFFQTRDRLINERERKIPTLVPVPETVVKKSPSIRNSVLFDGQNFLSQVTNPNGDGDTTPQTSGIMEEQFRLAAVLDSQMPEEESMNAYLSDPWNKFVCSLLSDEEKFVQILQSSGFQKISFIFEKLKRAITEHRQFFQLMLRLKQIIKAASQMASAGNLDEALESIIQQCVKCLNCDRASCFILDETKGQLWSKVAKGVTGVIRLPANQGIVGHVATQKKLLNIPKAYQDPRFNPDFDRRTNYKTETILCLPILKHDKCLGVIQCINKKEGVFTKEDECLGRMLCDFSQVVLGRTISEDEGLITISKLRQAVNTGMVLKSFTKPGLVERLLMAEKQLKVLMSVDIARIVVEREGKLIFALENGTLGEVEGYQSLIGQAIQKSKPVLVSNCYDNVLFSPLVDLQTSLPVVCIPFTDIKGKAQGGFILPNVRAIQNMVSQMEPRLQPLDEEVLEAFSHQLMDFLI